MDVTVAGVVFQFMSVGTMVRTHKVVPLLLIGWFITHSNWFLCTKHIIIHLQQTPAIGVRLANFAKYGVPPCMYNLNTPTATPIRRHLGSFVLLWSDVILQQGHEPIVSIGEGHEAFVGASPHGKNRPLKSQILCTPTHAFGRVHTAC